MGLGRKRPRCVFETCKGAEPRSTCSLGFARAQCQGLPRLSKCREGSGCNCGTGKGDRKDSNIPPSGLV